MEDIREIISRFDIRRINEYRIEIMGILIVVSATFLFYQYLYLKNDAKIKMLDSQIQMTEADTARISADIKETQKTAERLKDLISKLRDMEERFIATRSKLPSDRQLSSILKGLIDDNVKKDIKFISLRPLPLERKEEYFRLPFQISMQARFQSFGEYLEGIEEMPRIINVENFRIEAKEESRPLLSVQLFMSTYVLGGK